VAAGVTVVGALTGGALVADPAAPLVEGGAGDDVELHAAKPSAATVRATAPTALWNDNMTPPYLTSSMRFRASREQGPSARPAFAR
jgi:hypothetical protein